MLKGKGQQWRCPPGEDWAINSTRNNSGTRHVKSLDKKLKTIAAGKYTPAAFILADAKDPEYAFGVRATGVDGHDLVAHFPERHAFTHRAHDTREFESGDLEGHTTTWVGVTTHALEKIGSIERRRANGDLNLVRSGNRIGNVFEGQDLRATVCAQDDGSHAITSSSAAGDGRAPRGSPRW